MTGGGGPDDHDRIVRNEQSLTDLWNTVRYLRDRFNTFEGDRVAARRYVLTTTIAAAGIVLVALGLIVALVQNG